MSLIDQKGISAADKLCYLKKYVAGQARKKAPSSEMMKKQPRCMQKTLR